MLDAVLVGVGEGRPPVVRVVVVEEVRLDDIECVLDPVAEVLREGRDDAEPDPVPFTLMLAVVVALEERVMTLVREADAVAVADLDRGAVHVPVDEVDAVFVAK